MTRTAFLALLVLAGCASVPPDSARPFTLSHWQDCSDGSGAQCMVVEMADGWYELGNPSRIGDTGYH